MSLPEVPGDGLRSQGWWDSVMDILARAPLKGTVKRDSYGELQKSMRRIWRAQRGTFEGRSEAW